MLDPSFVRPRAARRIAAVLALAAAAAACGADPEPPSVLVVSVDTLRADHLGTYGYARDTSPHIDAWARRGVVFERVASTAPWTLPAHASMLTGRLPSFHGLVDDGHRLPAEVVTVAERLSDAGYATLAVTSHTYVSSAFGLDRGFDTFDDSLIDGGRRNPVAAEVVDRFLGHFAELPRDRPFFAFVHLFDPHWNYAAPEPWRSRFTDPDYAGPVDGTTASLRPFLAPDVPMPEADRQHAIDLYDGEIAYVDAELGRLLDALSEDPRSERAVVALTSDHGEEFKDHDQLGHGRTLFAEQLRVPLVVAGGPFPAGVRRTDLVSPLDLGPTLLALAGLDRGRLDGRSLLSPRPPERTVISESVRFGLELRAVQDARFKLVEHDGRRFYYDLERDPGEHRPLSEDPTGGVLDERLAAHAAAADAGWHLKLVARPPHPVEFRIALATAGRFVDVRRSFSQNVRGGASEVHRFRVSADGRRLTAHVTVRAFMGAIAFETEPPDAAVEAEVRVASAGPAGAFLGDGHAFVGPAVLERGDPRLVGKPSFTVATPGAYLGAVAPVEGEPAELDAEALEHLRALGYEDAGGGTRD